MDLPKIKIIVDNREKNGVLKALSDMGAEVETASLKSGDFILSQKIGVERKTVHDFVNSLSDGRLFEQADNLVKNFEKPIIIIEGSSHIYNERKIHPNAIRGAISALASDFRIPIIKTSSEEETASFLFIMAAREQNGKNKEPKIRGERKPWDENSMQEYLIASLPGVGNKIARNLLKKFKTIKGIANADVDDLKNIDKIGTKKAQRIKRLFEREYEF